MRPVPARPQLTWGLRQGGQLTSQLAQARNRGDTQRESALRRHIPNSRAHSCVGCQH